MSVTPPSGGGRPQTSDVARINGHITHVLVENEDLDGLHVFYDGKPVLTGQIENLGVEIVAPDDAGNGTLTGILSRYETDAEGTRKSVSYSLFPGTLEVIARGRRISVYCAEEGSFDGLVLRFGDDDGVGLSASGVSSLRIVVTAGLVDARLIWSDDNREDTILPV